MKRCPDCGASLPFESFPRNRSSRDGHGAYCKTCHNRRGRESKARNGGANRYHRRRRYGVDDADIARMLRAQEGGCMACRRRPATDVDHDHRTGRVRGMLCSRCNTTLGKFKDDRSRLVAAIAYLKAASLVSVDDPHAEG